MLGVMSEIVRLHFVISRHSSFCQLTIISLLIYALKNAYDFLRTSNNEVGDPDPDERWKMDGWMETMKSLQLFV